MLLLILVAQLKYLMAPVCFSCSWVSDKVKVDRQTKIGNEN